MASAIGRDAAEDVEHGRDQLHRRPHRASVRRISSIPTSSSRKASRALLTGPALHVRAVREVLPADDGAHHRGRRRGLPQGRRGTLVQRGRCRARRGTRSFEPIPGYAPLLRIRKRPDGACGFLSAEGLCRIHKEMGADRKPIACQLFPFSFHPAEGDTVVTTSFACPTVIANEGAPLTSQARELRVLHAAWMREHPGAVRAGRARVRPRIVPSGTRCAARDPRADHRSPRSGWSPRPPRESAAHRGLPRRPVAAARAPPRARMPSPST